MFVLFYIICILFLTLQSVKNGHLTQNSVAEQTNIVLIGATGDLARKYLWKGFFNLFKQHKTPLNQFNFLGASRLSKELGHKQMMDILEETLSCSERDEACLIARQEFIQLCTYIQLKTEVDYQNLGNSLQKASQDSRIREISRIFYLSVPPFAYSEIVQRINRHCRPNDDASLKVVLEKPFGSNLKSAQGMAEDLVKHLKEKEVYRIDHYLGKPGVTQILKFRSENTLTFEPILNRDHVESVEIVLKEKDDCRRRTAFYDKYGVIRDVIQNHMTELLTRITMDLPNHINNLTELHLNKLKLLKEIIIPSSEDAVIGQYNDYNLQYRKEKADQKRDEKDSKTATFAAVVLYINNPRWQGVPFVIISGKKLDERTAYVKILFKNNFFKIHSAINEQCKIRQLVFNIQGGNLKRPSVLVSHNLPQPLFSSDYWQKVSDIPTDIFGCRKNHYTVYGPLIDSDAYSTLIGAVVNGRKDLFIGTDDLVASWKIWTPLLNNLNSKNPRIYTNDISVLDFELTNGRLQFVARDSEMLGRCGASLMTCDAQPQIRELYKLSGKFRGKSLITGPEADVVHKLSIDIMEYAFNAITSRGVFHLALSGGSTSLKLFQQLAQHSSSPLWRNIHIWMVDERCVPITDKMSNFFNLHNELLQIVKIPYFNIHPMLIRLKNGLCNPEDKSVEHYDAHLKHYLGNNTLDYVVLGVGSDGHTASLFHGFAEAQQESNLGVKLSTCPGNCSVKNRMTMTFDTLNQSKTISVLILGKHKQNIVKKICSKEMAEELKLAILQVKPISGNLLWYIDDHAIRNACDGS